MFPVRRGHGQQARYARRHMDALDAVIAPGRSAIGLAGAVAVVVVAGMIICGGPALTGRIGWHSTAGLAVVAAATLPLTQLDQGVGRSHPQLGGE